MFIAKNNDLIILAKDTREELENTLKFMVYTTIEETEQDYVLINGQYVVLDEALKIEKEEKQKENTEKAKIAIQQGYVIFKEAEFETNTQTCSDLTSTMLLMQASGLDSYTWLSRDDKAVELTLEDFGTLGSLISAFKSEVWNVKYLEYKEQIEGATTIEEVRAIIIDYNEEE